MRVDFNDFFKFTWRFFKIAALALLVQQGSALSAASKVLNVPLYAQQTNMWCWAAGGEMIMTYLGTNVAQCKQANDRFGLTTCCLMPTPAACRNGGWPNYGLYGFTSSSTAWGTALTFAQLQGQINANKPVGFSWGWVGGGGHYMDAVGYMNLSFFPFISMKFVLKNDPWPWNTNKLAGGKRSWITYSAYVSQPGHHVHWKDDYNITKR